jgi:hypothetical protein
LRTVGHEHPPLRWIQISVRQFGALPNELVVIDDHVHNVDAARATGQPACQFTAAARAEAVLRVNPAGCVGLSKSQTAAGASSQVMTDGARHPVDTAIFAACTVLDSHP